MKRFSGRFIATMEPITTMLKEEEDSKAEILSLPAPNLTVTASELPEAFAEINENVRRRISQQNEEVRTRLDKQDETLRAQAEASSRIELLLTSLVARLPPPNGA
ncbi:hypothetical protein A2U01_0003597 [Trifolium medium]|uniref:Uncharacterized protein n=1 Tax=Trifolium medium TaxID=97028 RepID=A0A392M6S5_9FABA|nr:hypothetical protein [Trifolium medium]